MASKPPSSGTPSSGPLPPRDHRPDLSSDKIEGRPTGMPKKPFNDVQWMETNPFRDQMPTQLTKRDGKFGKMGKKATIELNSHAVLSWPDKTVYQYDVSGWQLTN